MSKQLPGGGHYQAKNLKSVQLEQNLKFCQQSFQQKISKKSKKCLTARKETKLRGRRRSANFGISSQVKMKREFLILRGISMGACEFLKNKDRSRSNIPYKPKRMSVPIDYNNYVYKRKRRQLNFSDFTPKFSYSFMEEILERNDWRIDLISTPTLCYQGEAVSVFNLLNNVTTLNINSRVGTFAVDEDILLNKSMKSENHKINRKLYAITPHGQFCR